LTSRSPGNSAAAEKVASGSGDPKCVSCRGSAFHPPAEAEGRDLRIAVDSPGIRDRQLYDLYYRWGCSVRETAQRLGKPEGTITYEL